MSIKIYVPERGYIILDGASPWRVLRLAGAGGVYATVGLLRVIFWVEGLAEDVVISPGSTKVSADKAVVVVLVGGVSFFKISVVFVAFDVGSSNLYNFSRKFPLYSFVLILFKNGMAPFTKVLNSLAVFP